MRLAHGRGNAFYLATAVENARFPRHERAPLAILILIAMIACLATGILSPVVSTWLAALAMVGIMVSIVATVMSKQH